MKTTSLLLGLALIAQITQAATITVTTTDNASPAGDGQTSFLEALQSAQAGDTIGFNIAGAGPHVIQTPMGGYPFITANDLAIDGYSQPGASPNTNPILGGNNAVLKIVLDSSGTDTAPGPELPLHRSTRLLFPGFGDTASTRSPRHSSSSFSLIEAAGRRQKQNSEHLHARYGGKNRPRRRTRPRGNLYWVR